MRKTIVKAGLVLAGWAALCGGLWLVSDQDEAPGPETVKVTGVHCPSEDSCEVDYRDGAWHVTEVAP